MKKLPRPAVWLTALGVLAAVAVGVVLVLRFVAQERERDLVDWQIRLGIVADSRKQAVDAWLAGQWHDLDGIAQNNSVQLFLSELKASVGGLAGIPDGESQAGYIENLLVFTASQDRFASLVPAPNLPVNIARTATSGLALFDASGRVVVATQNAPAAEPWVAALVSGAAKGKTATRDLYIDAAGNPTMAFLDPVFAVQGDETAANQVGWVLGVKEVAGELYPLLRQPGEAEKTADAALVRAAGANVEYLSPLPEQKPLSLALAAATPGLAEAAALRAPGGFGLARDYRNTEVLYTSRAITRMPWVLVYKIDRAEALADTDRRGERLMTAFLLALLFIAAAFAAVWRHGASRRASEEAGRYRRLAERFEHQSALLRHVTDGQPNAIFIADEAARYTFANRRAAAEAGISADDMLGKSLAAVIGPAKASRYVELNRRAMRDRAVIEDVWRSGTGASVTVLHSQHIPLEPVPDIARGVLVIEEDLSQIAAEQERRRATLDHLVRCLISLSDLRDPDAAGHSAFVAEVAHAVAEEMGLEPILVETAEMAGRLMNLGKVLVPAHVLTRAGPLTPIELEQLHESLLKATQFLEGIEFDGPVIETLRQCQEHWDGTGRPNRMTGRAIVPTARVLAVANAFVGLMSPRSYRPAMGADNATRILLAETGTKFDPAVVAALVNHLENRGGRTVWTARPATAAPAVIDPP
jgi:HD-GYP domain-containing protein (c-di-GMP phosphodiesterase class II)